MDFNKGETVEVNDEGADDWGFCDIVGKQKIKEVYADHVTFEGDPQKRKVPKKFVERIAAKDGYQVGDIVVLLDTPTLDTRYGTQYIGNTYRVTKSIRIGRHNEMNLDIEAYPHWIIYPEHVRPATVTESELHIAHEPTQKALRRQREERHERRVRSIMKTLIER